MAQYRRVIQTQNITMMHRTTTAKEVEMEHSPRIDVDLDGIIQFQNPNDATVCIVRSINKEGTGAVVATSDRRVCMKDYVKLHVFAPPGKTLVSCVGKVIWHSEDGKTPKGGTNYTAGISITDITPEVQATLQLAVVRATYIAKASETQEAID